MQQVIAENLTPESEFSLEIQWWYDKMHTCQVLLKLMTNLENSYNRANTYHFTLRKEVEDAKLLIVEQVIDDTRISKIKQEEPRKREIH